MRVCNALTTQLMFRGVLSGGRPASPHTVTVGKEKDDLSVAKLLAAVAAPKNLRSAHATYSARNAASAAESARRSLRRKSAGEKLSPVMVRT